MCEISALFNALQCSQRNHCADASCGLSKETTKKHKTSAEVPSKTPNKNSKSKRSRCEHKTAATKLQKTKNVSQSKLAPIPQQVHANDQACSKQLHFRCPSDFFILAITAMIGVNKPTAVARTPTKSRPCKTPSLLKTAEPESPGFGNGGGSQTTETELRLSMGCTFQSSIIGGIPPEPSLSASSVHRIRALKAAWKHAVIPSDPQPSVAPLTRGTLLEFTSHHQSRPTHLAALPLETVL